MSERSNSSTGARLSLPQLKQTYHKHALHFSSDDLSDKTPFRHASLLLNAFCQHAKATGNNTNLFFPSADLLQSEIKGPKERYAAMYVLFLATKHSLGPEYIEARLDIVSCFVHAIYCLPPYEYQ
ncbi:unnamed protein product [Ambrosiozyma monospora]|uniref:Unnamed protein product n=1 Tax=Ambrosiozyma monospora TaxID=43982 RepID=A0ACB5SX77_AMBMO|nr:unnamed protein product [Ambrosiozyma monospora]